MLAIKGCADGALFHATARVGDAGLPIGNRYPCKECIPDIYMIAKGDGAWPEVFEQGACRAAVMLLTGRQQEAKGRVTLVDHCIDPGAQFLMRATNGVIRSLCLVHAACRSARMMEMPVMAIERGLRNASTSTTRHPHASSRSPQSLHPDTHWLQEFGP